MKKENFTLIFIYTANLSYADDQYFHFNAKSLEKNNISLSGFYFNLGLGTHKLTFQGPLILNGIQINVELGNQWYFYEMENIGIGLKVSWLQLGFGPMSFSSNFKGPKINIFEMKLLKFGPQFTYSLTDDIAIDVSADLSFPILEGQRDEISLFGYQVSPGARFRNSGFAAGFDLSIGQIKGTPDLFVGENEIGLI